MDVEVTPRNFGRIAAMTAKQVITQRIREAEREMLYDEYIKRENEIVSGKIERMERGNLYIDIGRVEAVLPSNEIPPNEQPVSEHFKIHQRVLSYISEVKNGNRGMQVILSRTHPGLVKKLFEREVPELSLIHILIKCLKILTRFQNTETIFRMWICLQGRLRIFIRAVWKNTKIRGEDVFKRDFILSLPMFRWDTRQGQLPTDCLLYTSGYSAERFINICMRRNIKVWNIEKKTDGSMSIAVSVSYTHLDVYKRQGPYFAVSAR